MKRLSYIAAFMALATSITFLTACTSDDDGDKNGGKPLPGEVEVAAFNQIEFLQNNIVEVDASGKMLQRISGAVLNSADTTELYIGVNDINGAYSLFYSFSQTGGPYSMIAPSSGHISKPLTDEDGKEKETAYFDAVEDGPNIAEVTFATNKVLKHFTKIKFIKECAWPNNTESQYAKGDTVTYETANEGMQKWVCIREAKCGVAGLMMYISQQECDFVSSRNMNCSTKSVAEAASELLREDWQMYVTCFKKAGSTLDDSYYWIETPKNVASSNGSYAMRLRDGDVKCFGASQSGNGSQTNTKKRYIQVRTFGI